MKTTVEISEEIIPNFFYRALLILIRKPQVINRKLSCSANKLFLKINASKDEFLRKIEISELKNFNENLKNALIEKELTFEEAQLDDLDHINEDLLYLSLDKYLPRNAGKFKPCYVLSIIDCHANPSCSIYSLDIDNKLVVSAPFHLTLNTADNKLMLDISSEDAEITRFLNFVLLRKFQRWIDECKEDDKKVQLKLETHSLIDSEEYNKVYTELKEKYGKRMEEIWKGESTDPKKFVYEDVAIATYLIILWKQERAQKDLMRKQSFVDLGCGNGLLVYILSEEGHAGYGIDVRERKIWKKYDPQVDLREQTWQPNDTFKNIDWIIGNHSDELSPWVSVAAVKSSYSCNYFLLPCCAFEFSGAKFSKRVKDKSLYLSYIDYLIDLSQNVCGFSDTKVDRLKIPSTKRICLVAQTRSYPPEKLSEQCQKIDEYVKQRSDNKFTPRDKVELVRNCTRIDKSITERIVKVIFDHLLSMKSNCVEDEKSWNLGGEVALPDAAKLVSADDLKKLKSEFGGLQTLFKNKQNIFEVKNSKIKIRKPKRLAEFKLAKGKKFKPKMLPCYFNDNHPQGCLLNDEDCLYSH